MSGRGPHHDRAVIIATGDEIIVGQLLDTNSPYLAERLVEAGVLPIEHAAAPDDLGAIVETLRRACRRAPLVVMSGGLGPTDGDLTREALAEVLGDRLVPDADARRALGELLARRGRELTERQARQAFRPSRAACLPNAVGTAPGLHAVVLTDGAHGESDVFCLPGPPGELRPMFESAVRPMLRPDPARSMAARLMHVVGIAEADCATRLGDLLARDANPLVGITASGGILTLRARATGPAGEMGRLLDGVEARARADLGDHLFSTGPGVGSERLARTILALLDERRRTLGVVESCTGGMLGEMITAIPGSSSAFLGGFVTYANALKESLGVDPAALAKHGAVSAPVAEQMALRGLERAGADFCLSITGIAGPDGGSPDKPVGTVHVGVACKNDRSAETRRFVFSGDREDVRRRSCVSAMAVLYFRLKGRAAGEPRLLWQAG